MTTTITERRSTEGAAKQRPIIKIAAAWYCGEHASLTERVLSVAGFEPRSSYLDYHERSLWASDSGEFFTSENVRSWLGAGPHGRIHNGHIRAYAESH